MQKIIACAFLFSILACTQKNGNEYEVKGTLKNAAVATVYLEEVSPETMEPVIVDSASIKNNGRFELSTLSKGETIYNLRLQGSRYPFISFINDSKEIKIDADFKNFDNPYTLSGSEGSQSLKDFLYTLGKKINELQAIAPPKDTLNYKKAQRDSIYNVVNSQRTALTTAIKNDAADFISKTNHSPLVLYALSSYQSIAANPSFGFTPFSDEEMKNIIGNGAKKFPQDKTLATINQRLQTGKEVEKKAPDFILPDVNGTPVALSSFKGKYVLVDFWASWCPPCRAENPNVVAAFKKFKDKNFTILGVSLDKEKTEWQKAIAQDSLAWTQVSDLKFWDSKVVPLYGINEIPYNILIDPQGNMIAQNLTGEALDKKLYEVLK